MHYGQAVVPVRRLIAAATAMFPEVSFSIEPGRRGTRNITWTGGPDAQRVGDACPKPWPQGVGLARQMSEAESEAMMVKWQAQDEARRLAEPARRAKAKLDGIAKRAASVAARKALLATLSTTFAGTPFQITRGAYGGYRLAWAGGPSVLDVMKATGATEWWCQRTTTPAEIEAAAAAKAAIVEEAERRNCEANEAAIAEALIRSQALATLRRARLDVARRQVSLPLDLPSDFPLRFDFLFGPLPAMDDDDDDDEAVILAETRYSKKIARMLAPINHIID